MRHVVQKGDKLTSGGDGCVGRFITRKDMIKPGMYIKLDCPAPTNSAPSLADIGERMRALQAKIANVAEQLKQRR